MAPETHSGAVWAGVHPLFSLFYVLETFTPAFEHKQLMAYVCVCRAHLPMALQGTTQQPQSPFPCHSSLFKWEERTGAGTTSGLQTLVGPTKLPEQLCSPFCVESTVMAVPSVYRDQPWASLCTCHLRNIYQQPSFILLFPAFHFLKKNNSRPFVFTTEHDHQEISQGKK